MKYVLLFLLSIMLFGTGCNNRRSSPGIVDTLVADTSISETPVIDSAALFEQLDEFETPAPENTQPAMTSQDHYFMIVGSFTVPQNAENYAAKIRGMGYSVEIIPGRDSFQMVSAQSYGSYQESISDIERFRNEITPEAWVHVRN